MTADPLYDDIRAGKASLEDWSASVAGGTFTPIADNAIVIHTGYLFGNVTAILGDDGLILIDSGSRDTGQQTFDALRRWSDAPVRAIVFTHGHIDHTWGARLYDAEADAKKRPRPRIFAHRNVLRRFQRYDETHALNSIVMGRQFNQPAYVFPDGHRRPDEVYDDALTLDIGGVTLECRHGRGETDDATFVWWREERILVSGDFVIWVFPNAGNPRKAQRYAPDWAAALRYMRALQPRLLAPGHGPVVCGEANVAEMLADGAEVLESLVRTTLELMNAGADLDEILQKAKALPALLAKPWLRPKYDDPEFVVRNIWHLYAGWFDGDPAHLKPSPKGALARELAALAGGAEQLSARAQSLAEQGDMRLAVELIELAANASPAAREIQQARAAIYARCVEAESSLIGKALYGVFRRDAAGRAE